MKQEYHYVTLDCGVKAVMIHRPGSAVEIAGVAVNAGSRDEPAKHHGLAHFVEHTIFKGTTHRRAWHVNNRMESIGGELNAYTTKEETFIYTTSPRGYMSRAIELLADLVCHATFPLAEIDREREVVADEIASYLDSPAEGIYDDFDDLIYAGSGAGHNILGTRRSIDTLTPQVCHTWLAERFTACHTVFFYSGPMSPQRVAAVANRHFADYRRECHQLNRRAPEVLPVFDTSRSIASHQAHTVMGVRIPGLSSNDRLALALLTNVVGGPGMNSLLNVALREKRGLVYTIEASTALMSDAGLLTIYFGCDHDDVARCRALTADVLAPVSRNGLDGRRLAAAKRQLLGQLTVSGATAETSILGAARATLHRGRAYTPEETAGMINLLTVDHVAQAAAWLDPERMSVLSLL